MGEKKIIDRKSDSAAQFENASKEEMNECMNDE